MFLCDKQRFPAACFLRLNNSFLFCLLSNTTNISLYFIAEFFNTIKKSVLLKNTDSLIKKKKKKERSTVAIN